MNHCDFVKASSCSFNFKQTQCFLLYLKNSKLFNIKITFILIYNKRAFKHLKAMRRYEPYIINCWVASADIRMCSFKRERLHVYIINCYLYDCHQTQIQISMSLPFTWYHHDRKFWKYDVNLLHFMWFCFKMISFTFLWLVLLCPSVDEQWKAPSSYTET